MESTRPAEENIPQASLSDTEDATYVTLLTVQREVGITRGTLKKYLTYLGIEPVCFHIGTRSLYISREAMTQVAQLKQNPSLLAHLPRLPLLQQARSEQAVTGDATRKDSSDGR